MKQEAVLMKSEIRTIANYKALQISKNYINGALIIAAFFFGYFQSMSPFYILIIINLIPIALSVGIPDLAKKSNLRLCGSIICDKPFRLNILKKKYKYSRLHYISASITYLFAIILLGLWQYRNSIDYYGRVYLQNIPCAILLTGLTLRLFCIFFYRRKLPYDLLHNKI